ncbi:hypothetical protein [Spiroplasma alleghenense]|uniref:Uncharacterized protein n=1 Tax=Spiroplasma alleghenense TaxID=216931 RepID=A0A345Z468_9MOLU|nr:hypothetical protein [Spiroplasma alleghenense]AXK51397.1 hypothetical protein SALLE_v1c07270 [Spiroplasma alleghenense]
MNEIINKTRFNNDEVITSEFIDSQMLKVNAITGPEEEDVWIGLDAVFVNQQMGSEKNAHYDIYLRPNISAIGKSGKTLERYIQNGWDMKIDIRNVNLRLFAKNGDITSEIVKSKNEAFSFGNLKWNIKDYKGYQGFQKFEIPVNKINLNGSNLIQYELNYEGGIDEQNNNYKKSKNVSQGLITINNHKNQKSNFEKNIDLHVFKDDSLAFAYLQYNPNVKEIRYYRSIFNRKILIDFERPWKLPIPVADSLINIDTKITLNKDFEKEELENFGLSENFFNSIQNGLIINQLPFIKFNLRSLTGRKIDKAYAVNLEPKIIQDNSFLKGYNKNTVNYDVSIANRTVFDPFLNTVRPAFYGEGARGLVKNPNFLDPILLDMNIKISGMDISLEIPLFSESISNYNMFFLNKYDNIINGDSIEQFKICFLFTPDIISRFVNINDLNFAEFQELESLAEKDV